MRDRGIQNVEYLISCGLLEFKFLHDIKSPRKRSAMANRISRFTIENKEKYKLLPMTKQEILEKPCVALLFDKSNNLVASASMMKPEVNGFGQYLGEIGSMFTVEEWQHRGIASFLVHKIDEWASGKRGIHGAYAFLNTGSPKSMAVNGYSAEINYRGFFVNAAKFLPPVAINLCLTACAIPEKVELINASRELSKICSCGSKTEEQIDRGTELAEKLKQAKIARTKRFSEIVEKFESHKIDFSNSKHLHEFEIAHEHQTLDAIIQIFQKNLENDLRCCDVAVVKLY